MYHKCMQKKFGVFLILALLAGCSGNKKTAGLIGDINIPPEKAEGAPPAFALPGVPLKNNEPAPAAEKKTEAQPAPAAEVKPEAAAPAPAPAPAEAAVSSPAAVSGGDLEFHLRSARKYSAAKRYRSAAAEYGAAVAFLPAGDAREVQLLERQGAMMLRVGDEAKAQEHFLAAIARAGALNVSGNDLANSYLGLGYCQEKAKKPADAIGSYEKAMELSASKKIKDRIAKTISDLKKAP